MIEIIIESHHFIIKQYWNHKFKTIFRLNLRRKKIKFKYINIIEKKRRKSNETFTAKISKNSLFGVEVSREKSIATSRNDHWNKIIIAERIYRNFFA